MAFDPVLAGLLVRLCRLAYRDEQAGGAGSEAEGLAGFRFYSAASTQAFVAHHDRRWFLAFRGTEAGNPVDWARDARFDPVIGEFGGRVHSGFRTALDELWPDLTAAAAAAGRDLYITGHSLGAGLATLAAARLVERGLQVSGVYTFGQPRTGLRDFATRYDERLQAVTFRFVNHIDLVTRVPLLVQRYWHVGRRMYFDADGGFHPDAGVWQVAKDDLAYRLSHFGRIESIGLGPHGIGEYVRLVNSI